MQKPKELRRIVFDLSSAAEALTGTSCDGRKIEITKGPRHILIVEEAGQKQYFDEVKMIEALSVACRQFNIPCPLNAHKRILVDRAMGYVMLQISIDMVI